jgi:hypothetical protein
MLFVPELTLTLEADGGYSLQATTKVPTPAHMAAAGRLGTPPGAQAPVDALCVILPIVTGGAQAGVGEVTVTHRVAGLEIKAAGAVHAYVTVDGTVSGEASVGVAAVRAKSQRAAVTFSVGVEETIQISPADCLAVVVITTPKKKADSPTQQLHELGVVDDKQTRLHQNKVAAEMANRRSSIKPELVNSGPNVTIADCSHSVYMNQGS